MSCKSQDYRLSRIKIEERRCTPLSFLMIQKLTFLERSQSFFVEFQGVTFSTFSVYTDTSLYLHFLFFTPLSMSLYLLPHTFLLLPLSSFIPCHFPCLTFPFSPLLPYPSSLYRHSPSHPPYLLLLYHLTILLLFIDLPLLILHTFPFTFTLLPLYTFPFFYSLQASHSSTIYLLLSSLYLLILLYVPNSS